jgi:hypothetical protein
MFVVATLRDRRPAGTQPASEPVSASADTGPGTDGHQCP